MKQVVDDEFAKSIEQAVAITVTFNLNTPPMREEEDRPYMVGVRMLQNFSAGAPTSEPFQHGFGNAIYIASSPRRPSSSFTLTWRRMTSGIQRSSLLLMRP